MGERDVLCSMPPALSRTWREASSVKRDDFKRKPVSHITRTRTLTNINFVKDTVTQRTTYKLELTLECGHVQMSNGGRPPKLVTCKTCREKAA
jgi:hypothetical protein